MKFIVDKGKFQKAITTVESVTSTRDIRSIISNVMLEAIDGELTLTATDLEMGIRYRMEATVEKTGSVALPAKKLSQTIREFKGNSILFELFDADHIQISDASGTSKARISMNGMAGDEFPAIPSMDASSFKSFPTAVSQEMIRKTSYAVAEEDARYVFNGLYMVNEGNRVTFVGTDGRRLSRILRDFPEQIPFKDGIILPNKAVKEVFKLLDSSEQGEIAFNESDRSVFFKIGNVQLICKLIDGQFPPYNQVIPQNLEHKLLLDRNTLEDSVRQVAVMASEPTRQVRFTFSQGTLSILAQTQDVGEARDMIPCGYEGEEITIAFNSSFLLDVIRVISADQIEFGFSSSNAPVVVNDPTDGDFVSVIMPMKI